MKECKHKFRPRYDEKWTTPAEELAPNCKGTIQAKDTALRPYIKEQTYIYDICIKCGKTVTRVIV